MKRQFWVRSRCVFAGAADRHAGFGFNSMDRATLAATGWSGHHAEARQYSLPRYTVDSVQDQFPPAVPFERPTPTVVRTIIMFRFSVDLKAICLRSLQVLSIANRGSLPAGWAHLLIVYSGDNNWTFGERHSLVSEDMHDRCNSTLTVTWKDRWLSPLRYLLPELWSCIWQLGALYSV
jgi:hypothetical protein